MSDDSYGVGYRRPPKATRFQKGRSGNPKGRPKKTKSFMSLLAEALDERVWINEGGRRKSISKRQALAKQFANKGAGGDIKAVKMLIELSSVLEQEHEVGYRDNRSPAELKAARERVFQRLEEVRARFLERIELFAAKK